jgi:hypothetical protein
LVTATSLENLEKPLDAGAPARVHVNSGTMSAVLTSTTVDTSIATYSWTQTYSTNAADIIGYLSGYCSATGTIAVGGSGQVNLRVRVQTSGGGSTLWDSGVRWQAWALVGNGNFRGRTNPVMPVTATGLTLVAGTTYQVLISGVLDATASGQVTFDYWSCQVTEAKGSTT